MNTNAITDSRSKWPLHTAAVSALALASLVVPVHSSASNNDNGVDGVLAQVKRGALEVTGSRRADAIALRLKAGDPNRVEVDVGGDGSADFSFARSRLAAIDAQPGRRRRCRSRRRCQRPLHRRDPDHDRRRRR